MFLKMIQKIRFFVEIRDYSLQYPYERKLQVFFMIFLSSSVVERGPEEPRVGGPIPS